MEKSYLGELREAAGLSQGEVASKADLSDNTVEKWEREGYPRETNVMEVLRYARALECSVEQVHHFNSLQREEA